MKVAIVGSRDWPFPDMVTRAVDALAPGTVVVSGAASGVDSIAAKAARSRGLEVLEFPADWKRFGKSAGYRRNVDIVTASDEVIAFQFNKSDGTQHTIDIADEQKKPARIRRLYG